MSTREYTPRLLKEISEDTENGIYETLQELRILFPSYRDDQLLVFWLGRLQDTEKIDIHDFNSDVSFVETPKTYLSNVKVHSNRIEFEVFKGPRSFGQGDFWDDGSIGGSGPWSLHNNMSAEVLELAKTEARLRNFKIKEESDGEKK